MHVLVAGCGWLGTAAAQALSARGDRVTAVVRSLPHAVRLMDAGVPCLSRDLAAPGGTDGLPGDCDAILATQSAGGSDAASYRRAYLEVPAALIAFAARTGVRTLIATGSTGVFGQRDGSLVDEETPPAPADPNAEILVEMERLVLSASREGLRTCVVRASGLYGPGRTGTIERVRSGALARGNGDGVWMNFCHRDDAVAVLLAALDRGRPGTIYHASDREPVLRGDVVDWIAMRLKMTAPHAGTEPQAAGRRGADRRISSEKTLAELGVRLAYPTFRKGMAPLTVALRV